MRLISASPKQFPMRFDVPFSMLYILMVLLILLILMILMISNLIFLFTIVY